MLGGVGGAPEQSGPLSRSQVRPIAAVPGQPFRLSRPARPHCGSSAFSIPDQIKPASKGERREGREVATPLDY